MPHSVMGWLFFSYFALGALGGIVYLFDRALGAASPRPMVRGSTPAWAYEAERQGLASVADLEARQRKVFAEMVQAHGSRTGGYL